MATWNSDNIILTKLGEQVLSKVQSGVGKLTVSRIVSGAGHISPAQLYSQTQITDIKQEMSVVKYTTNEQQSVISANLTNTGLEEAYDLYQIGIYVTHPDFTDEVLYLIAQCDSPDHIPLPGDNPVTLSYDLVMAHFGTKEVTINVSEAGHVDVTTFNEFIEKTNTALNRKADLSDIPTTLPANGGNADTVDGKHASDFLQATAFDALTHSINDAFSGTYSAESSYTPDFPSGFGSYGIVDSRIYGSVQYQTIHFDTGVIIHRERIIGATDWSTWKKVNDGGNAYTLGGIAAGELDRVKTAIVGGERVGALYTALQAKVGNRAVRLQVDATVGFERAMLFISTDGGSTWTEIPLGNAATVGGIGKDVIPHGYQTAYNDADICINSGYYMLSNTALNTPVAAYGVLVTNNGDYIDSGATWAVQTFFPTSGVTAYMRMYVNGSFTPWVNIADGGSAATANTSGTLATTASNICLRNLSSGTADATTTNCPSGAWYGKHD